MQSHEFIHFRNILPTSFRYLFPICKIIYIVIPSDRNVVHTDIILLYNSVYSCGIHTIRPTIRDITIHDYDPNLSKSRSNVTQRFKGDRRSEV